MKNRLVYRSIRCTGSKRLYLFWLTLSRSQAPTGRMNVWIGCLLDTLEIFCYFFFPFVVFVVTVCRSAWLFMAKGREKLRRTMMNGVRKAPAPPPKKSRSPTIWGIQQHRIEEDLRRADNLSPLTAYTNEREGKENDGVGGRQTNSNGNGDVVTSSYFLQDRIETNPSSNLS
jgi:hypothetical protein